MCSSLIADFQAPLCWIVTSKEELRSLIMVQRSLAEFKVEPKKLFCHFFFTTVLHLICEEGTVNDKDLAVSSYQGNTCLFIHLGCLLHNYIGLCLAVMAKSALKIYIFFFFTFFPLLSRPILPSHQETGILWCLNCITTPAVHRE